MSWTDRLADFAPVRLIFPPSCEWCGELVSAPDHRESPYVCSGCRGGFETIGEGYCRICGHLYEDVGMPHWHCSNCRGRSLGFDFAVSAYRSEGRMRDLMHRFKYQRKIYLSRLFGQCLTRVWRDNRLHGKDWVIVPVPLHPRRYRSRRFNQALEIARVFRTLSPEPTRLRILPLLRRLRHTQQQAQLDREDRLVNLEDAFGVRKRMLGRVSAGANFLILDDVITTGATASECASVLQEWVDPESVAAISVLRG